MILHKGIQYTISLDGDKAVKTGSDRPPRTMRHYPERDSSALAGYIDELTAWRLIRDVASEARSSATPVSPEHIFIDGEGFTLSPWSESSDPRYAAPEGYDPVWALGATVFYLYLGCHVFQGLGGAGQTATTPVPTLRRQLPRLSRVIADCLNFDTGRRPSLEALCATAESNMDRCGKCQPEFPPLRNETADQNIDDNLEAVWPEEIK